MYTSLHTLLSDGIFTITINRPDKLNALNKTVMAELGEVIDEVYANKDIKGAILTGAGPKAFVAGADISEFRELGPAQARELAGKGQYLFFKIENSPKPIIAAVNGFALGGGCELAMACHFRLCSVNARFGQPEVNLGIIPGYGGTQRLTRLIGKGRAMELILSAVLIDAQQALQLGLVNYVTEPEELLPKALSILQLIGEKAPVAVSKIIECVNIAGGGGDRAAGVGDGAGQGGFAREKAAFGECFDTADVREGTSAFLEKRKPRFSGK